MKMGIWLLLLVLVIGLAYIRLAPSNPDKWHRDIRAEQNEDRANGAVRIIPGDGESFRKAIGLLGNLPRTHRIDDGSDPNHATFVTRSVVFGFPDYTTVQHTGDQLKLFARLRFGKSDLGVNRKRLEAVLSQVVE